MQKYMGYLSSMSGRTKLHPAAWGVYTLNWKMKKLLVQHGKNWGNDGHGQFMTKPPFTGSTCPVT